MSITVRVEVTREDGYWIGLPEKVPGSFAGRTLDDMKAEARAALPLLADCEPGDLSIDYVDGSPAPLQGAHR